MAKRETARRRRLKVGIGDLDSLIDIGISQSTPAAGGKTNKTFDRRYSRYAKLETLTGRTSGGDNRPINGRNTTPPSTHAFTTRFRDDIAAGMLICFKRQYYEIQGTTDIDGRREYLKMRCRITGDIEREASEA